MELDRERINALAAGLGHSLPAWASAGKHPPRKVRESILRLAARLDVDPTVLWNWDARSFPREWPELRAAALSGGWARIPTAERSLDQFVLFSEGSWPSDSIAQEFYHRPWYRHHVLYDGTEPYGYRTFVLRPESQSWPRPIVWHFAFRDLFACERIESRKDHVRCGVECRAPELLPRRPPWQPYGFVRRDRTWATLFHCSGLVDFGDADETSTADTYVQTYCGPGATEFCVASIHPFSLAIDSRSINKAPVVYFYRPGEIKHLGISPVFISYSHRNEAFVGVLVKKFRDIGVKYWIDTEHATAGRLDRVIEYAMKLHPTVLLVLSEHSVESEWIEFEVNAAVKLTHDHTRDCLCPVALDGTWLNSKSMSGQLLTQIRKFSVLDFSKWQDETEFTTQFDKLFEGLRLHY